MYQYFAVDSLFCIYLLFYFSKHDHLEMEFLFSKYFLIFHPKLIVNTIVKEQNLRYLKLLIPIPIEQIQYVCPH